MAETYDGVAAVREERGEDAWRWPIAERFLEKMRADGKTRVFEIGAGVGYTSRWFADHGLYVVATDLSPAQVELCRAKGLDAHVRDMYELGFPADSFDAAWAMNCVHHIPNADFPRVLQGIADVLVPGGLFYVGVWGGVDDEG
ncbi:class I SAM-dependent methyltransferase, partial [bacterium]|nr:class I SAM-dependent methyltransferase [bacterium]